MPADPAILDDLIARLEAATPEMKLDRVTTAIARAHGCDRGTFTVCWAEQEQGLICICKEEAARALRTQETTHAD